MNHNYKGYLAWGITGFAVAACAIVFYFGLDYLSSLIKAIGSFLGILSPFIWGLVISYLLMPSMVMYEKKLFAPLLLKVRNKYPKAKLSDKLPRVLAVILAEIVLVLIITALIYLIVPQVYESIAAIVANSGEYFDSASKTIDRLLQENPVVEQYATKIFGNLTDALTNWAQNTLLPSMDGVIVNITTGVYGVLKVVYNIVIGIIVSVYILYNRESFRAHAMKLLYCICSTKTAKSISEALKFTDRTFMGFITGKLLDSAIIGVICYIGCLIMNMPYALLVSVIVGVTNVIPFFGPFIGAIPSALLILLVDPWKCLIFVIFILGGSIGINGFWVMFSIILFGGLFGFWGMLLGVPVFVVIYTGVTMLVDKRLKKKDLPDDPDLYSDLDHIDPESGVMIMRKQAQEEK